MNEAGGVGWPVQQATPPAHTGHPLVYRFMKAMCKTLVRMAFAPLYPRVVASNTATPGYNGPLALTRLP